MCGKKTHGHKKAQLAMNDIVHVVCPFCTRPGGGREICPELVTSKKLAVNCFFYFFLVRKKNKVSNFL